MNSTHNHRMGWRLRQQTRPNPFAAGSPSGGRFTGLAKRLKQRTRECLVLFGVFWKDLGRSVIRAVQLPLFLFLIFSAFLFVTAQRHNILVQKRLHSDGLKQRDAELQQLKLARLDRVQRVEVARLIATAVLRPENLGLAGDPGSSAAKRVSSRVKPSRGQPAAARVKAPSKTAPRLILVAHGKAYAKRKS